MCAHEREREREREREKKNVRCFFLIFVVTISDVLVHSLFI